MSFEVSVADPITIASIIGVVGSIFTAALKGLDLRSKIAEITKPRPTNLLSDLIADTQGKKDIDTVYATLERIRPLVSTLLRRGLLVYALRSTLVILPGLALVAAVIFLGGALAKHPVASWVTVIGLYAATIAGIWTSDAWIGIPFVSVLSQNIKNLKGVMTVSFARLREAADKAADTLNRYDVGLSEEGLVESFDQTNRLVASLERFELVRRLKVSNEHLHDYLGAILLKMAADLIEIMVTSGILKAHADPSFNGQSQLDAIKREWDRNGLERYWGDLSQDFLKSDFVGILSNPTGKAELQKRLQQSHPSFQTRPSEAEGGRRKWF